jgi:exonuclease III
MKYYKILFIVTIVLTSFCCFAEEQTKIEELPEIDYAKLAFGEEETLEIMSWNIQNFPKTVSTVDYAAKIITAIDADVIGLQEIQSEDDFEFLLSKLDTLKWSGFRATSDEWEMNLAYLYKKDVIEVKQIYEIFPDDGHAFPRAPLILEMKYKDQDIVIINNHFKAKSGEKNEQRRIAACDKLYKYTEENYPETNICILGDLNDKLIDDPNVFEVFIDDENYRFADMKIAEDEDADWSYPYWKYRGHIDHILISNELFDEFSSIGSDIKVVTIDKFMEGGGDARYKYITDHRPVVMKLKF